MNALKKMTVVFLVVWLLAQFGAVAAMIGENIPLLWASIAAAWIGGAGAAACLLLRKGQSLLWLIPVLAIWGFPMLLAAADVTVPPVAGTALWVAGIFLIQKLPNKLTPPAAAAPAVA